MSITRTAIIDDDGTLTVGTIFNNAWKTELYDQIDDAIARGTIQTTTATGTQHNFALTAGVSILRCNNASLLTFTGFVAGVTGQRVWIVSVGNGQVDIKNLDGGSTATNEVRNGVTGTISLSPGVGRVLLEYDQDGVWKVLVHEQGAWITPAYAGGNFTASAGTWTVDAGDVGVLRYRLTGRTLRVQFFLDATSVSATPAVLKIAIPGGFVATARQFGPLLVKDNGGNAVLSNCECAASGTTIDCYKTPNGDSGNFATATNTTRVQGEIEIEVN